MKTDSGKEWISPKHTLLQYMGRIDFEKEGGPELVYPCTFVKMRFVGTECTVRLKNTKACWDNYMGYILDGEQHCFLLSEQGEEKDYILAEKLPETEHEIMLFKRQDSCHTVQFLGFVLNQGASLQPLPPLPKLKMEVYGDSVSAGEVSEAIAYIGKADPQHNGEYSNSYYSYAWMTARKLNAQLHDIAQGGLSLLDDTGWFAGPHYKGLLSMYDKIEYHPDLGVQKRWKFDRYIPDVVVVAIGQNDSHPIDYMAEDYGGEDAAYWRETYLRFIMKLRLRYPKAYIILTTTILGHDVSWDRAIDEVCKKLQKTDSKVSHFLYSKNGCGTAGHIRIPEADKMSDELAEYVKQLLLNENKESIGFLD